MSIPKITGTTSLRSVFRALNSCRRARMASTLTKSDEAQTSSDESRTSCFSSSSSPWLMLSPRSTNTNHDLYSFAENMVLSIPRPDLKYEEESGFGHATRVVGFSKGWLACFNHLRGEVFLSNPLSGRRVNLPPIHNLSIPESNLRGGYGCIQKIVISCFDPESEDCRAMMSFNTMNRLAFCCPGHSPTEWTIIGSPQGGSCQDFVYCSRDELFFSFERNNDDLAAWDLRNPLSPSLVWSCGVHKLELSIDRCGQSKRAIPEEEWGDEREYLVASQKGDIFLVRRYINPFTLPDGSRAPCDSVEEIMDNYSRYPSKTVDFGVYKIVREGDGGKKVLMDSHLDGLVMFIGSPGEGMAMPVADADGFQPNSICFTSVYGSEYGTDNGIFDYKEKTFSSCYYPRDYESLKNKILPPPLWIHLPIKLAKNKEGGGEVPRRAKRLSKNKKGGGEVPRRAKK